jgi:hypothetical protein
MSSLAKETPEETPEKKALRLRVAALKALGTSQKKIAEARNILKKMLKKGGEMNQKIVCSMHQMLTELRGNTISETEKFFNESWKTFTPELLEACNKSLSTLTPPISFNFELFPGPEAVLAEKIAKEEKDCQAAEELHKFWEESERLARERAFQERVGFGATLNLQISQIVSALMLQFMNDCQSQPEAVDGPHAECNATKHYIKNFAKFEGEIDAFLTLFVTDPKNREYEDRLHPFHDSECIRCKYDSKPTSLEYSRVYLDCPYCTILLICGIIIDNQRKMVKTVTHPGWNAYLDMIMVYGMQQRVHRRFHSLLMCVYLRSKYPINPRNSDDEWKTNPIKAILGFDQSLQAHFINALKGRFNQDQIRQEMAKDKRFGQDAFIEWRKDSEFKQ